MIRDICKERSVQNKSQFTSKITSKTNDLWLQRNSAEQQRSQQPQDKYTMHFHSIHTPTYVDICINVIYTLISSNSKSAEMWF